MTLELPDIPADERTPLVESLLAIIRVQQDCLQQLEETVQQLRDVIAILKGQKPRLVIKPSVLEGSQPKTQGKDGGKRPGSAKRPKTAELQIHQEAPLHPEGLPVGATFRGYEAYVVQELIIKTDSTRYLRAPYDLPGGGSLLAPFPAGVLPVEDGNFGANLLTYILDQYHQAQVTEPLLLEQLWEFGINITDNGAFMLKGRGLEVQSNAPLREGGVTTYEGGVRVPAIVRWPGRMPPGTICREMLSSLDVLPMIVTAAGGKLPADRVLDGRDPTPTLAGKAVSPHAALYWMWDQARDQQWRGMREGTLKIVRRSNQQPWELYDLSQDIGEAKNRAGEKPERVKELAGRYERWHASVRSDPTRSISTRAKLKP